MKSKRIGSALVIALVAVLGVGATAASPNTSTQVSTTSGLTSTFPTAGAGLGSSFCEWVSGGSEYNYYWCCILTGGSGC